MSEGMEFGERLSYFGIATNLIIYLTKVLKEDLEVAARNSNYWMGVTTLMPLLGGFVADGLLGRFATVFFSTIIYLLVSELDDPLRDDEAAMVASFNFAAAFLWLLSESGG
jgi:hypothetical protein